ncbi:hypothetical protein Bca4012_030264 [Brassica carinata]
MPGTTIGFSYNSSGLITSGSGIVGLSWASLSLISWMGESFLDSGTTFTYLPRSCYNKVTEAVENVLIAACAVYSNNMLCYKSKTIEIFPVITMHFYGGADLVLD